MDRGGTYKLDLPKTGLLSALDVYVEVTQELDAYIASGGHWMANEHITKVEVLANASVPIVSATGRQVQMCAFRDTGMMPQDKKWSYGHATPTVHLPILFGRYIGDPKFALDLSRYNNVSLQITNDFSSTYYHDDAHVYVVATYLRDLSLAQVLGHFRKELYRSWTTVQNQPEYNELPVEFPIRRVYLQAIPAVSSGKNACVFTDCLYNVRLMLRSRTVEIFNGHAAQYLRLDHMRLPGMPIDQGLSYFNADVGFNTDIGYPKAWAGIQVASSESVTGVAQLISISSNGHMESEVTPSDYTLSYILYGQGAFSSLCFPFDMVPDDPTTFLDPETSKQVTLDVTTRDSSGAASGTNHILLDRFVA